MEHAVKINVLLVKNYLKLDYVKNVLTILLLQVTKKSFVKDLLVVKGKELMKMEFVLIVLTMKKWISQDKLVINLSVTQDIKLQLRLNVQSVKHTLS